MIAVLVLVGCAARGAPADGFDRSCTADPDCAVVRACAGLTVLPDVPEQASCGDVCFAAVRAEDVARWTSACAAIEAKIPCEKKLAKCDAPSSRSAACVAGRCELR